MQAAFFDLDGCLVDSSEAIPAAFNAALIEFGLPAQPALSLRRFIGPPLLEGFTTLLTELGEDPARAADAVAAYRAVYGELARTGTHAIAGVDEVLAALRPLPMAVVTSKPAEFAGPILEAVGLADHFRGVYAPSLEAMTESKAVALRRALEEVVPGAAPGGTAMVGDRYHDVVAARTCGVVAVGVTWGAGDRSELDGAGADHVVDHPHELTAVLGARSRRSRVTR